MAISSRTFVLLAVLQLLPLECTLHAQPREHFRFDHLRVEQGLSQGSINAMMHDRKGFLWIGTDDGLNRFDGYQFVVLRPDPSDRYALAGNVVTALSEDPSGKLWIGTSGSGFQSFDPVAWTFASHPSTLPRGASLRSNVITAIQADASKRVWIGTDHDGLLQFDIRTGVLRPFPLPSSAPVRTVMDIALTRTGKLIVACGHSGLFVIDARTGYSRHIDLDGASSAPGGGGAMRVTMDSARYLWVGSDNNRIHRYDIRTGKWRQYRIPIGVGSNYVVEIRDMAMDLERNLWISTSGDGVFVMQTESGSFTHLVEDRLTPMSLPSSSTRSLCADRLGNVWVGTNGSGMGMHSPAVKEFNLLGTGLQGHGDLTVHSIRAIWQDRDSVLWVGGYRGFNRVDRKTGEVTVYERRNYSETGTGPQRDVYLHNVFVIHPDPDDPDGALLVGTEGSGLFRFVKKNATFQRIPLEDETGSGTKPQSIIVTEICRTRDGVLWIGCSTGLWRWDPGKRGSRPERIAAESFGDRQGGVYAIHEDRNGLLWIGTARGGIALFDRLLGDVTEYRSQPGNHAALSSNSVKCIYEDSRGMLWVGTTLGLNLMKREDGSFQTFTTRDGLPNNVIYGILEDASGMLWLSTNNGLARFHPEYGVVATYDVHDGLQGNEFNTAAFFISSAGEMFFGGVQGLTFFNPDRITRNHTVPPMAVTSVRAGNRSVLLQNAGTGRDTVMLDYRDESITFTFAALSFYRPEKNRYSYRFEGRNEDWIDIGYERNLSFAGLGPGTYTLRVRGSNNDGVWNEDGLTVTLIIEPPFWAAWWFRVLAGLLLAGLAYIAVRWRMKRVHGQERKLAAEVELRTSELQHSNAKLLLEIEERKRAEAEAYRANATKSEFLAHISHEIRTPMNAILGFTELLYDRIRDAELRDYLNSISVSGKTLLTLINDILDLSKIEAGKLELSYHPASIRGIIDEIRQLFAYQIGRKKLALEVLIDERVPSLLYLDETRIRQILLNLVGNAVKFTERGTITIEAKSVMQGNGSCTLILTVKDTGVGIAPSQQERVFEPFRQGGRGRNTDYDGTGLGLAITQRLIEMMGGEILLRSRLGAGSTFRVTLPALTIAAETMEMDFGDASVPASQPPADVPSVVDPSGVDVPREELQRLYTELSGLELIRWERLKRTYLMHEIEGFATDLRQRAETVHYPPLIEWSERLVREARSFDMEHLPRTLDEFPHILAVLNEQGNTTASSSPASEHD